MSTEKTAFRAEVAEVERWWKVRLIAFPSPCIDPHDPFLEPPLCAGEEAIHSRRRRFEVRDAADIVSRQCGREKSLRALFGTL